MSLLAALSLLGQGGVIQKLRGEAMERDRELLDVDQEAEEPLEAE